METSVIFDGTLQPNQVSDSQSFTNGQFLLFDVPGLQQGEGVQIGMSIILKIPIIGKIAEKILPMTLIERDLSLNLDTNLLFPIPREITESGHEVYCSFASTETVQLRAYVITSNVTQESLLSTLDNKIQELKDLITNSQFEDLTDILLKSLLF
ncbi:hypothetical protein C7H19_23700 [Aphanothece hegewaldii CCALA 016]|uniref:Uncharacterized protein n=1 Tax=Aphanothece hegewaldii CCALA 016 TaxID=2107694 RepID=A0A2T1LR65_9CHRO|nr:hypothetical protein [Aphanothece hegewaldii]PSF30589.1 hypothetical protein C7H19_23700 [Aphanothece hegewaldii CCALA 016]